MPGRGEQEGSGGQVHATNGEQSMEKMCSMVVKAALQGRRPHAERQRPLLVVMFGGICCGKSTAANALLRQLHVNSEELLDVNVDALVYLIPGLGSDASQKLGNSR